MGVPAAFLRLLSCAFRRGLGTENGPVFGLWICVGDVQILDLNYSGCGSRSGDPSAKERAQQDSISFVNKESDFYVSVIDKLVETILNKINDNARTVRAHTARHNFIMSVSCWNSPFILKFAIMVCYENAILTGL